jgi:hypothetical protein
MGWAIESSTCGPSTWMAMTGPYPIRRVWQVREPVSLSDMRSHFGFQSALRGIIYLPKEMDENLIWAQPRKLRWVSWRKWYVSEKWCLCLADFIASVNPTRIIIIIPCKSGSTTSPVFPCRSTHFSLPCCQTLAVGHNAADTWLHRRLPDGIPTSRIKRMMTSATVLILAQKAHCILVAETLEFPTSSDRRQRTSLRRHLVILLIPIWGFLTWNSGRQRRTLTLNHIWMMIAFCSSQPGPDFPSDGLWCGPSEIDQKMWCRTAGTVRPYVVVHYYPYVLLHYYRTS